MFSQIINFHFNNELLILILILSALVLILIAIRFYYKKFVILKKQEKSSSLIEVEHDSNISEENSSKISKNTESDIQTENITIQFSEPEIQSINQDSYKLNDTKLIISKNTPDFNIKSIGYNAINHFASEESNTFPYVIIPKFGTAIKPPKEGRIGRKGFTEEGFKSYLVSHFSDYCILSDNHFVSVRNEVTPYEPDFTLINEEDGKNIFIDVEIDEPYEGTNDILTRKPIHFGGSDSIRNYDFQNRGWIVIRFAEIQIHQSPLRCCLFIANVISSIDSEYKIPTSLMKEGNLEPVRIWSEFEARNWSVKKHRESYLKIDSFGLITRPQIERMIEVTQADIQIERKIKDLFSQPITPIIFKSQSDRNLLSKKVFLVPYRKKNLWTLYNLKDNLLVNDLFDYVYFADNLLFKSNNIVLIKNDKYCLVNSEKDFLSKVWYDYMRVLETDNDIIYVVSENNKYGIIDNKSNPILSIEYQEIKCIWMLPEVRYCNRESTKEKYLIIRQHGKWGLFETNSLKLILPFVFDDIHLDYHSNKDFGRLLILYKDNFVIIIFDVETGKIVYPSKNDIIDLNKGVYSFEKSTFISEKVDNKEKSPTHEEEYPPEENYLSSDKTLWKISDNNLIFDEKFVYKVSSDTCFSGFYNGIGQIVNIWADEDNSYEQLIGYLDIYGNRYFED